MTSVRGPAAWLALAVALLSSVPAPERDRGHGTGTLIAAFVTKTEVLLCSDGRVVNSTNGSTVRDDWPKVHRLTDRSGLLAAGRDLPGLLGQFERKLGAQRPDAVSAVASVVRGSLEAEWAGLAGRSGQTPAGRAFTVVAGFDADGAARLFFMDSASRPPFHLEQVGLFGAGQDLEVFAIASNSGANEDVSALLVRNLEALVRQQPGADRRRLMLSAFNAAKEELGRRNSSIGGATFAARITPQAGFERIEP